MKCNEAFTVNEGKKKIATKQYLIDETNQSNEISSQKHQSTHKKQ